MTNKEQRRILDVYSARAASDHENSVFFGLESVAHDARIHERLRETRLALQDLGYATLRGTRILDVGCGDGNMLRHFCDWGASPESLAGIELRPEAVAIANDRAPRIDVRLGSATRLPWADETFDIVCQHTVFTSVLDNEMKFTIASEMQRVLRSGGAVLWYDFMYNNPNNPNVRGVKRPESHRLFQGMEIRAKRISLAPPIARRIPVPLIPIIYPILSSRFCEPICSAYS